MNDLKKALASAVVLAAIEYGAEKETGVMGEIIVAVDACGEGWGGVLMQVQKGQRRPVRYESGVWRGAQLSYHSGQQECLGLLMMLRKTRHWIYGVPFTVETDASSVVGKVNNQATDIPNAIITRWIAYIQLFDFQVRHVPGKKHGAPDALSRRGHQDQDKARDITGEIEDIIDARFYNASLSSLRGMRAVSYPAGLSSGRILDESYSASSESIAQYLCTLRRPDEISGEHFRHFRKRAMRFLVKDGLLFRRAKKGVPLRRVLDGEDLRTETIRRIHDEIATHRGREAVYNLLAERY
jgi:hypothetical protein